MKYVFSLLTIALLIACNPLSKHREAIEALSSEWQAMAVKVHEGDSSVAASHETVNFLKDNFTQAAGNTKLKKAELDYIEEMRQAYQAQLDGLSKMVEDKGPFLQKWDEHAKSLICLPRVLKPESMRGCSKRDRTIASFPDRSY
ncbi:MAG: hypothetical protein IPG87_11425 [Saprospiraceae bacterium]|nr:hypothetical protein [Candidatus Vicinibacter affinis]